MNRRSLTLVSAVALMAAVLPPAAATARPPGAGESTKPVVVRTSSDQARTKLHPKLREQVESGSTDAIYVFATVFGDTAAARAMLTNAHEAAADGAALVVGSIRVHQLPKFAALREVVSVAPIELRQTGQPLGSPEPELNRLPSTSTLQSFLNQLRRQEVPYDQAPALAGSNFDDLKALAVLDAKTHGFADAWNAGYAGEGVTVSVLDGGTDWGHPDLIGTWQLWSGVVSGSTLDAGWNGWPKAFDPFGTLIWLVAPDLVDVGFSWYTPTVAKSTFTQNAQDKKNNLRRVTFDTRTGPARNFFAPDGTRAHQYTFPSNWTASGTVRMGSHPDDHLLALFTERPAFIVVDPNTAGVYDTVYVDLDNDYQFADEKPVTKASPVAYRDMNGDGYTDISGGLLYYISDGATRIPGGLTSFLGLGTPAPASGELLAWTGDYDPAIGGHGTLTASNVVGQGVINGGAPVFSDIAGGRYPGAVIGGAPKAKLAPMGDIYFSFEFSTQLAYFLTNLRRIDVTTNSYGNSAVDNDGYDAGSQEAAIWHLAFGGRTTALFSTGNGAPGFGTVAPPTPFTAVSVGASTQFGGTGWDSIRLTSQIVDNDVMVWSNRGPGATGSNGTDVVADGAFSAGDITLNAVLNGRFAWETWGGTSRSAPVAGAATALVYQAWKAAHGPIIPPFFEFTAKDILKSSATDLGYESWIQGGGSVHAGRAVGVAAGSAGAYVSPSEWRPGDYRGDEFDVFTHLLAPGDSDSQTFAVNGPGAYSVSDRYLVRTDSDEFSFTSARVNKESAYNFNAPDYLIDITDTVEAHPDADLMVVRANFPYSQFDPNGNYSADQDWRLLTYNWTDGNGDGNLWTDLDNDGAVDHVDVPLASTVDGFAAINFAASEMDQGEYIRLMYHRAGSNTLQSFVREPADRMADGIFVGLQHSARHPALQQTDFTIRVDFYENVDWPWLSVSPVSAGEFTADITVPADAPYGMYDGAIVLSGAPGDIVVPVSVTVAPEVSQDGAGRITGSLTFGGADVAAAQADLLYNNGSVFGASDWTWRAESGDWRFYYFDVPTAPPDGSLFLVDTTWSAPAPYTDLDTLIFGPSENAYQLAGPGPVGGPYILDTVGKSPNTNVGGGVWLFDTATGGPDELVAGPAQEGLHAVVEHQVGFQGDQFHVPFEITVGSATVDPAAVDISSSFDTGTFDVTFQASIDLPGLTAEGFGLSQPSTTSHDAQQDDPNDPSTASVKVPVTISHASRATFNVDLGTGDDIDLYVVYDGNGDGNFTNAEIVGASLTPSGTETVELGSPPDGNYEVWVHGFTVVGTPAFPLTIDIVQGSDLSVSGLPAGAVPAGTPVTIHVDFSKSMVAGQDYFGDLLIGPPAAPSALRVPITIHRLP